MVMRIEPIYHEIGSRIAEKRVKAGLRQEDVALRAGLSRTSLTNIEAGRQRVLIHHVFDIAEAIGCQFVDLIPGANPTRDYLLLEAPKKGRVRSTNVVAGPIGEARSARG